MSTSSRKSEKLTRDADRVERTDRAEGRPARRSLHWYSKPMAFLRSLPGIDIMPPTKIQQISLPELTINYNFKEVPRYDRCTTCHQGIDRLGYDKDADGKPMTEVFASHPHPDRRRDDDRPQGQGGHGGPLPRRQRPAPDQQLRLHDLPRRPGVGDRLHLRLAHAQRRSSRQRSGKKKYHWHAIHHWDYPMLPKRFLESSCLKCHHEVTDVPQAKKLQAGYQRIVKYGCTGCHTIGGEGSFGPDLTDEPPGRPEPVARRVQGVEGVDPQVDHRPARLPARFADAPVLRPDQQRRQEDWPKNYAEANAIAHYLFTKSTEPAGFVDPAGQDRPGQGARSCSSRRAAWPATSIGPMSQAEVQLADREAVNPGLQARPVAATYDPKNFPASVRDIRHGRISARTSRTSPPSSSRKPQGYKWLANWIHAPEKYHPKSLMPNLQLSFAGRGRHRELDHLGPGRMARHGRGPRRDSKEVKDGLDELVKLYVAKSGSFKNADGKTIGQVARARSTSSSRRSWDADEKLFTWASGRSRRLGCFGCHTIPGFENAKPIGTALNDWGLKSPARLDLRPHPRIPRGPDPQTRTRAARRHRRYLSGRGRRTSRGSGFLFQKLHRPAQLRLPEEEREVQGLGRPAPDAPVRLGQ